MANLPALPFHSLSKEVVTATVLACVKDNRLDDIRIILNLSSREQISFLVDKCIDIDCTVPVEEMGRSKINAPVNNPTKYYNWCLKHASLRENLTKALSEARIHSFPGRQKFFCRTFASQEIVSPEVFEFMLELFSQEEKEYIQHILLGCKLSEEQLVHAEMLTKMSRYDRNVIYTVLRDGKQQESLERARQRMSHPSFDPNDKVFLSKCLAAGGFCMEIFDHPRLDKKLAQEVLFPAHLLADKTLVRFLLDEERVVGEEPSPKKLKSRDHV